jgi:hypothetical protein
MSSYVRRAKDGRQGWTGPIRSDRQAQREAQAWTDAGWTATVEPSTPEIRAEVRKWETQRQRYGTTGQPL